MESFAVNLNLTGPVSSERKVRSDERQRIRLAEFCFDLDGTFSLEMETEGAKQTVVFQLPARVRPANDLIAYAFVTLLGTTYSQIEFELPIPQSTRANIERLCRARCTGPESEALPDRSGYGHVALNFSGGFDSLAALSMLGEGVRLVSLDFGGPFSREADFFRSFSPHVVSSNLRAVGLARNSWAFMAVGSILLRDHLQLSTYSFGAILEASAWNLNACGFVNQTPDVLAVSGLKQLHPVIGLTEVGTTLLALRAFPSKIPASLASLARHGSEKHYRKWLLASIVSQRFDLPDALPPPEVPGTPFLSFGSQLAGDFLLPYLAKHATPERYEALIADAPSEVLALAKLDLTFYERLNTNFYNHIGARWSSQFVSAAIQGGIGLYGEKDWHEFHRVVDVISDYHSIPGRCGSAPCKSGT